MYCTSLSFKQSLIILHLDTTGMVDKYSMHIRVLSKLNFKALREFHLLLNCTQNRVHRFIRLCHPSDSRAERFEHQVLLLFSGQSGQRTYHQILACAALSLCKFGVLMLKYKLNCVNISGFICFSCYRCSINLHVRANNTRYKPETPSKNSCRHPTHRKSLFRIIDFFAYYLMYN